ncbi:phosphate-starvation-inducible protein PsiE [Sulfurivirga sp.]|uniref:phosphate-starvation-inducible protein PsiE n=1 Tax=Sulfurivirga sp. TaxID=2614236 RepID=UPI00345BDDB0
MSMQSVADKGKRVIHFLEIIGLFVIGLATLVAAGQDIASMIARGHVKLADLLMLFLYLEVLAMTAIYLDSGKLPIRLPIYIAIVALARFLVLDMKELDATAMLLIAATILVLALAVLVLRYGALKYPYKEQQDRWNKPPRSGRRNEGRHAAGVFRKPVDHRSSDL